MISLNNLTYVDVSSLLIFYQKMPSLILQKQAKRNFAFEIVQLEFMQYLLFVCIY